MKDYYRAALLVQFKNWLALSTPKPWVLLEKALLLNRDLTALLLAKTTLHTVYLPHHPLIEPSLAAWEYYLSDQGSSATVKNLEIPFQTSLLYLLTPLHPGSIEVVYGLKMWLPMCLYKAHSSTLKFVISIANTPVGN